ncbi:MAG: hypothetical protein A3H71_00985 [Candidatus Sungbacteria bacterium RIFCSPLOWO2_02_FULL_48_13b]|uniref:Uncharacterized protein n=2 Tax=Candidatus Sungiibacteriota TaxID=1817917 RepID=A0A1G2LJD1_9BACT|nr:MAG: hypothetical protein A3C12_01960 [Candidatus Sungbacteria bacterium RIFCSPHIGHO2_02_FULL_49_20]OHA11726.1 MAG: hypothetical protein A3H71_00985 [Candidatus Sungbacteria bacterium RIFCSPLOWO2_02_FULL_48_13b]
MRKPTIVLTVLIATLAVILFVWFPPILHEESPYPFGTAEYYSSWEEPHDEALLIGVIVLFIFLPVMLWLERRNIWHLIKIVILDGVSCPKCQWEYALRMIDLRMPDERVLGYRPQARQCMACGHTQRLDPRTYEWTTYVR